MTSNNNDVLMVGLLGAGAWLGWSVFFGKSTASTAPPATDTTPVPTAIHGGTAGGVTSPLAQITGSLGVMPRGIRNNNPGNIVYNSANAWLGQIGTDGTFARFDLPVNGLRAMFRLLGTYRNTYGLDTISKIAARWAPAPANNPVAYARGVGAFAHMNVDAPFAADDGNALMAIGHGIIGQENGPLWVDAYPSDMMLQAFVAANQ